MPSDHRGHPIPISVKQRMEILCRRYEDRWHAHPAIESFLEEVAPPYRAFLFGELLQIDLTQQLIEGDSPEKQDYFDRWPQYESVILRTFASFFEPSPSESPASLSEPSPRHRFLDTPGEDLPESIGKYRIIELLGSGGQSKVYRVHQPGLGRDAVLKISLLEERRGDRSHLLEEAKLLARLEHPHIARIYDFDFHRRQPFLVMEWIDGRTLNQWRHEETMTPQKIASVVLALAKALSHAHRMGICHLDIKPQNVLLDGEDRPRLIDYGLGMWRYVWRDDSLNDGTVLGTPAFMPPEQARGEGEAIGTKSDLFGLGALLFYLMTGTAPFAPKKDRDSRTRAAECDIDASLLDRKSYSSSLIDLCLALMHPDPSQRPEGKFVQKQLEHIAGPNRFHRTIAVSLVAILAFSALVIMFPAWREKDRSAVPTSGAAPSTPAAPPLPASRNAVEPLLPGSIDLNRASVEELDRIPGLGASRAEKIVASRQAEGPFHSMDELQRITGIGQKTVDMIAPYLARIELEKPNHFERTPNGATSEESMSSSQNRLSTSLVNPNTASIEALAELPGIAEILARRLIDSREQDGPFRCPEDLLRVEGIGEKKMETLRPLLLFEWEDAPARPAETGRSSGM
jgi:competence ComEA-like helix-hairpin-helix protein